MNTPNSDSGGFFDSWDCVDLVYDGPGDNTVRPVRPELRALAIAEREKIMRWQAFAAQNGENPRPDKPGNS